MGKVPLQCIFVPSDHGLVLEYLNRKVRGEALQYDDAVMEMERHYIYGGKEPWDIFARHAQRENQDAVYLFTAPPPPNKNNTSTDINNNNNNNNGGAWKVQDNGTSVPVKDPDCGNRIVGFKTSFIYQKNDNNNKDANSNQDGCQWFMTEFTTLQPPKVLSLDYVVCKIEKKVEEDWGDSCDEDEYIYRPICGCCLVNQEE